MTAYNDFCPTPYEEGSEDYDRTMSKLDGSFDGPNLVIDYSEYEEEDDSGEVTGTENETGTTEQPEQEDVQTQPEGDGTVEK